LDFLRKYGYPVPETLVQGKPRVHLIDEDAQSLVAVSRSLNSRFEVTPFSEPVDALIAIGAETPDVIVLDPAGTRMDGVQCIVRLKAIPGTRHSRIVVFSALLESMRRTLDAGASAFVAKPDVPKLVATLDSLMGVAL
jgi:PleD family two-component response regulator